MGISEWTCFLLTLVCTDPSDGKNSESKRMQKTNRMTMKLTPEERIGFSVVHLSSHTALLAKQFRAVHETRFPRLFYGLSTTGFSVNIS